MLWGSVYSHGCSANTTADSADGGIDDLLLTNKGRRRWQVSELILSLARASAPCASLVSMLPTFAEHPYHSSHCTGMLFPVLLRPLPLPTPPLPQSLRPSSRCSLSRPEQDSLGLGLPPSSLLPASPSPRAHGEQPGLPLQPGASGSSRAEGHIPGLSRMRPSPRSRAGPSQRLHTKEQLRRVRLEKSVTLGSVEMRSIGCSHQQSPGKGHEEWGRQAPENFFLGLLPSICVCYHSLHPFFFFL